ncbi:hypothetical protein [Prevotella denticola]|uniref:hypothetical protein n=1 Tax=Prevotella denticola TaxID=28129 RepID=UPI000E56EBB8|nr:hypothetical protein [Prevotella denticola]AXV50199.1 hypothetical protein DYJ25_10280 [Prevotella denticola]
MEIQNSTARRPDHRIHRHKPADRFLHIRQWLNIIFMLGAVVGVAVYFLADTTTVGTVIILAAMVFKIIECLLRFIR